MDIARIQHEIEQLPDEQQSALIAWLSERDCELWEDQIERDFSARGEGLELLEGVKIQIRNGKSFPLSEGPHHS